jgi:ABC-type uncharacterized transport system substrate-binding protein
MRGLIASFWQARGSFPGRQQHHRFYRLRIFHPGKWLELLKQVAPQVTRVAVLRESGIAAGPGLFGAIQALAPSFGLELRPIDVRDAAEIERGITTFGQDSNSGMIVSGSPAQSAFVI